MSKKKKNTKNSRLATTRAKSAAIASAPEGEPPSFSEAIARARRDIKGAPSRGTLAAVVAGLLPAIPDSRAGHEQGPPLGSLPPFAASAAIPPPGEPQSSELLSPVDAPRRYDAEEPGTVTRPSEAEAATPAKLTVGTAPELSASMSEQSVADGVGRGVPGFRDISAMTVKEHEASFDRLCLEIGEYAGKAAEYYLAIGEKLGDAKRHYNLMTGTGQGKRNPQDISPFAELVAEKSGLTPRSIQLYVQVGRLDDAAKVAIARAPKATLTNLIKLARLKPEKQLAAAQTLTERGQEAFDKLVVVQKKKNSPPEPALVPEPPASAGPSSAIGSVVIVNDPQDEDDDVGVYSAFAVTRDAPPERVQRNILNRGPFGRLGGRRYYVPSRAAHTAP